MEEDRRCAWIHLSGQRSAVCEQLASPLQSLLVLLRAKVTEGAKRGGKETEIKRRKKEKGDIRGGKPAAGTVLRS